MLSAFCCVIEYTRPYNGGCNWYKLNIFFIYQKRSYPLHILIHVGFLKRVVSAMVQNTLRAPIAKLLFMGGPDRIISLAGRGFLCYSRK